MDKNEAKKRVGDHLVHSLLSCILNFKFGENIIKIGES